MLHEQRWHKMFEKRQQNRNDLIRIKITSYYRFAKSIKHHRGEHSARHRPLKSLKYKPYRRFAFFILAIVLAKLSHLLQDTASPITEIIHPAGLKVSGASTITNIKFDRQADLE